MIKNNRSKAKVQVSWAQNEFRSTHPSLKAAPGLLQDCVRSSSSHLGLMSGAVASFSACPPEISAASSEVQLRVVSRLPPSSFLFSQPLPHSRVPHVLQTHNLTLGAELGSDRTELTAGARTLNTRTATPTGHRRRGRPAVRSCMGTVALRKYTG